MRLSPIFVTFFIIFAFLNQIQAAQYYFASTENVIDQKKITFPLMEELEKLILEGEKSKNLKIKDKKEFVLNGRQYKVFEVRERGLLAKIKGNRPWFVAVDDKNKIVEMNLDLLVENDLTRVDIIWDK